MPLHNKPPARPSPINTPSLRRERNLPDPVKETHLVPPSGQGPVWGGGPRAATETATMLPGTASAAALNARQREEQARAAMEEAQQAQRHASKAVEEAMARAAAAKARAEKAAAAAAAEPCAPHPTTAPAPPRGAASNGHGPAADARGGEHARGEQGRGIWEHSWADEVDASMMGMKARRQSACHPSRHEDTEQVAASTVPVARRRARGTHRS